MTPAPRRVRWVPREPPLEPAALFARPPAAWVLLRRLGQLASERRERLRGLAGEAGVFVQGPADALPWVDGAIYLARAEGAPGLWLPTHRRPDVPIDLYARALRRAAERPSGDVVVLPTHGCVVSLDALLPLDGAWLEAAGATGS